MTNPKGRYMFAGHAIGVSARFHRLDEKENLNHVVPTLGATVVPPSGGRSVAHGDPYRYDVNEPRKRCLFSVKRVESLSEGRQ